MARPSARSLLAAFASTRFGPIASLAAAAFLAHWLWTLPPSYALVTAETLESKGPLGEQLVGTGIAVGPETLIVDGWLVRLAGIDSFEIGQSCTHQGERHFSCGEIPKAMLAEELAKGTVACAVDDVDVWGRVIARCHVNRTDLAAMLVHAGYAMALPGHDGLPYAIAMAGADDAKAGAWAGAFMQPWFVRSASAPF